MRLVYVSLLLIASTTVTFTWRSKQADTVAEHLLECFGFFRIELGPVLPIGLLLLLFSFICKNEKENRRLKSIFIILPHFSYYMDDSCHHFSVDRRVLLTMLQ